MKQTHTTPCSCLILALLASGCLPMNEATKSEYFFSPYESTAQLREDAGTQGEAGVVLTQYSDYRGGLLDSSDAAGPRIGFVYASGDLKKILEDAEKDPMRTAFGWQFEYQLHQSRDGSQALVEFVPLLVGLEQNMFQMNLNLFFGLRMSDGFEIHAGPTLSIFRKKDFVPPLFADQVEGMDSTIGMVFSFGMTFKMDELNMPVDLSVIKTESGTSLAVTFGWNIQRQERRSSPSWRDPAPRSWRRGFRY